MLKVVNNFLFSRKNSNFKVQYKAIDGDTMQGNKQIRYSYKGMSLYDYCKNKPELNYGSVRKYVYREKKRNPQMTDEEIIEQYMNREYKGKYRYYYVGIPLKKYCEENNIDYDNVLAYMRYHRKDDKFLNLDDDEFVEAIMEQYEPFEPKYMYNGILLTEYCKQNDICYTSVVSFVKRKLARGSKKNIDELIEEGIKTINRYGIIYYYEGIPLKDYAKENDLNYSSLVGAIIKRGLNTDKPKQEIVNECVLAYKKFSIKYIYNGVSLRQYCINIGLNYNTVINKYIRDYQDREDMDFISAIDEIINYYTENPPARTKYYFNNQTLARFCDSKGYSYSNILRRIIRMQNNNNELSNEQIIDITIQKYEAKLHIDKINDIFREMEKRKNLEYNDLRNICEFLKIDIENVFDLIEKDFSCNQAINIIWFFGDKIDNNGFKIITDKKLQDLFKLIAKLQESQENEIVNFELYDLICIYKSGLYDSRNEILIKQKMYIYNVIHSLCRAYSIEVNSSNFEDFESEIRLYLVAVINRINLNIYGQIVKYMDLTIKGCFREYLKNFKQQNNNYSLNVSNRDNYSNNSKPLINRIADTSNLYKSSEDTTFSSTMMQVLSSLSQEDVSFVMLKFQENYTDDELADYFKINIDEVKEKEFKILSLLKSNPNVQMLKKTNNY